MVRKEKKPSEQRENQQQTQPSCNTGPEPNPGHISGRRELPPLPAIPAPQVTLRPVLVLRAICTPQKRSWFYLKNVMFVCVIFLNKNHWVPNYNALRYLLWKYTFFHPSLLYRFSSLFTGMKFSWTRLNLRI